LALAVTNFNSNIPAPINNVYMRGLLSAARKTLPFFNGTLPGTLEKVQGSATVKWRRIDNLAKATTALSEVSAGSTLAFGVGRTAVTPTIINVTKAVAKYGNAIILTEEVDLFNINTNTMALMETLGANAGESLNDVARTEFDNATLIRYASGAANKSAVVAEIKASDIKFSVNKLNRNSAMKMFTMATGNVKVTTSTVRGSYFGICHPDVEEDIRDLTNFLGVEQYGGYTETLVGEFGAVNGVRWVASEIAPVETGAGTTSTSDVFNGVSVDTNDVYTSYIYGKEAIGTIGLGVRYTTSVTKMYEGKEKAVQIIHHQVGSSGVGDMFNEIGSIAWKAWHATKILNGSWIVKTLTLATAL
jgi:N4-gp56 family major capsid protein